MIIDSSALMAILANESEATEFVQLIEKSKTRFLSVATRLEIEMVSSRVPDGPKDIEKIIQSTKIKIIPVSLKQGELARQAFNQFGKGRHKAKLNMGDCFAYALAKEKNMPILAKGNDFRYTDIKLAYKK